MKHVIENLPAFILGTTLAIIGVMWYTWQFWVVSVPVLSALVIKDIYKEVL